MTRAQKISFERRVALTKISEGRAANGRGLREDRWYLCAVELEAALDWVRNRR